MDFEDEDEWWLDEPLPDPVPPPEEPPVRDEGDYWSGVTIGSMVSMPLPSDNSDSETDAPTFDPFDIARGIGLDLMHVRPGPAGLATLAGASRDGFVALTPTERVDALISLESHVAWLEGMKHQLLAAVADHDDTDRGWAREEVAAALRLAPVTAGSRMRNAQTLCHQLPNTLNALLEGRIAGMQAVAITDTAHSLPEVVLPELESRILSSAQHQTLSQTRTALRKSALRLDPEGAEGRHQKALDDRDVYAIPGEDGIASLTADLDAADVRAITELLNDAATQQLSSDRAAAAQEAAADNATTEPATACNATADIRTRGQIRADIFRDILLNALTDLLAGGDVTSGRSETARPRPTINVHVGLGTLVGTDDEAGWLDGYGPITAQTARRIAADPSGTWRRLITEPVTRRLLAFDDTTYRPPEGLERHVRRAHIRCTFPGCARPAKLCDLDHAISHARDGRTCEDNLHPLCRRHHLAKHHPLHPWTPTLNPDSVSWTSPQGRRYRTDHLIRLPDPPRDILTRPSGELDLAPF